MEISLSKRTVGCTLLLVSLLFFGVVLVLHQSEDRSCVIYEKRMYVDNFSSHRDHRYGIEENGEKDQKFAIPKKAPKLRIISPHFNRLDYLYIQYYSILTYILDEDWELVIVDNYQNDMKKVWKMNNISEGDIENVIKSFNDPRVIYDKFRSEDLTGKRDLARCSVVQDYVWKSFGLTSDGLAIMIDSDSVFYDYVNIGRLLRDRGTYIVANWRFSKICGKKMGEYIVHNSFAFEVSKMPEPETMDFRSVSRKRGKKKCHVECGGATTDYLYEHPDVANDTFVVYKTCLETREQIENNVYFDPELQFSLLQDYDQYWSDMQPKHVWKKNEEGERPWIKEKYRAYPTHLFEDTNIIHFKDGGNWMGFKFQKERAKFWWKFFKMRFNKEGTKTPLMEFYP